MLNMTIQIMIWLRLIIVIYYSFFVVMAIICLPVFFIQICTGDLDFSKSNRDKVADNMKKFFKANSRSFNEKCDAEGTCSICLEDFANSKDKQIT